MELSLLPLDFGPSLTVASRLFHPYSIEDKTPRFIGETILHSQEHLERFTDLYREEGPGSPREIHTVIYRREKGGGR